MNTLIKQKISTSPHIELHPNGRFLFDGSSLIIDAAEFYSDIMIWISDYYREPAEKTIVDIRISTTNSSSDSMLQKIFYTLNRLHKTKKNRSELYLALRPRRFKSTIIYRICGKIR